ncbi:D-methionine transport system permease protein MetI [Paenibacillus larvae subsp. larvae]|uniref:Metal ABC transporter permease n=2 Tax=Paenibacillus larvae TaxID=1464 RepID=A0A1V0UP30_9BACL|nr:methionine ABC transporter permease [Paenibacillus larvae]AQZ48215.1 metal ABC transporter permease [Paenibacillus larvae subsp. pulvifaciens]ARF66732.1 metal ABC transporter permease [Paenibacillus larvae subsp. pulvifaciens]AVF26189.1 D-methionine transport system permease protein MetI [Paenibacillus larvae subsp. larvae]AVF30966.1 D-methionine transport system permease protein MetI [Paenibacillus larvae subsp. larvae]MBH0341560.1 metal ABC transporter permease [Paenibacillus larvae]
MDFSHIQWDEISKATVQTMTMLGISTLFTFIIGLPLGILLYITSKGNFLQNRFIYSILSVVVNILRSVPFVILMIAMIPLTKILVGKSIDVQGTIPPLVVAAAPFFARLVETSLREVDRGVIEAAQSMGASYRQIIFRVLLPESLSGLIAGITITTVSLVSYTAMAGLIGGGGLGDLAIRYGYQRFDTAVMLVTIVILLILVQILQMIGDRLVLRFSRK